MGIANTKVGPFGIWQIIAIIGALIGIVAFFLVWGTHTYGIGSTAYTGMDLLNNTYVTDFQKYAPLLVLVFGVISLIAAVIPKGVIANPKITPIITLIGGLLMLVFAVLFIVWWPGHAINGITVGTSAVGIGGWLGLVGGILVLIPALLPFVSKSE
jgi:hypothetical protein